MGIFLTAVGCLAFVVSSLVWLNSMFWVETSAIHQGVIALYAIAILLSLLLVGIGMVLHRLEKKLNRTQADEWRANLGYTPEVRPPPE